MTRSEYDRLAALWTAGNNAGRGFAPDADSLDEAVKALAENGGEVLHTPANTAELAIVRTAKGDIVGIGGDAHGKGAWAVTLVPATR
jgi:hypothetical protein